MNDLIPVTARLDLFEAAHRFKVEEGITVLEIIKRAGMPDAFYACGVVMVAGRKVEPEWWPYVRPRIPPSGAPTVVTMHMVPHGGKTSQILGLLAAVAVVTAATLVSGGVLGPAGIGLLGSSFAAGGTGALLAGAAISVAGTLALSALAPPPLAPNGGGLGQQKNMAGVSANPLTPLEYLPAVFGKMRASPPLLAPPYTTLEDGEIFINGICGLFGAYEIANILLNGADIDLFDDVTYSSRQGLSTDTAPSQSFSTSVQEQRPNLKLSQALLDPGTADLQDQTTEANSYSDWHIFRIPAPGDTGKAVIRFFWPAAFNSIGIGGGVNNGALPIRIEIKKTTDSVWFKLPELHFAGLDIDETGEVRQQVTLQWQTTIGAVTLMPSTGHHAWAAYWKSAPGHANERTSEAVYTGGTEEYAQGVTRDGNDGFIVDIDSDVNDGDADYDIRIRAGVSFKTTEFVTTNWNYSGNADQGASFFNHFDAAGTSRVVSKGESPGNTCYVESVQSHKTENAFDYSNIASIAFKAKGLQIESLSAEFTSIVPIYSGGVWATTEAASQNPAALYRHVLLGPGNSNPLPGEIVDEDSLSDWYTHCASEGHQCNAIVQGLSVPQCLQLIAASGWATPRQSDVWGVIVEQDRSGDSIVQLLTPLNSRDLGTSKDFPQLPHAIRAEFFDEDEDYEFRDDVIVYADGYSAATATLIESIRYDGFTDATKVQARAQLDLDQLYLRGVRYLREVGQEGFITPRGSLVGLADEVLVRAQRYALIKTVTTSGGNVTGFTLDTVIDLAEGNADPYSAADIFAAADAYAISNTMGIAIRKNDGTAVTHAITQTTASSTVTLATPVADTGQYEPGQLCALGVSGTEYKRCIVMSVEPGDDETFRLVLADEAPQIHA